MINPVSIRNAGLQDLASILAIEADQKTVSWSVNGFLAELTNNTSISLVACLPDASVVGYALCSCIADECTILTIAVLCKYRKQHVGSALLQEIEKQAIGRNCISLFLEVRSKNSIAQNFYENAGFKKTSIRKAYYADDNDDAIVMIKLLESKHK